MSNKKSFEERHLALRNRSRRIIFNNDGGDVFTLPLDREPTAENLLSMRTRDLAGTHVDVISIQRSALGSVFLHIIPMWVRC